VRAVAGGTASVRASATPSSPQAERKAGDIAYREGNGVIRPGCPRDQAGDNEEQRDEVMAVTITPINSERPGHEVSERGPERNEVE
jgi:hypothetical protein